MWLQGRVWDVSIDLKKCCGMHSKEKEENGECCQICGEYFEEEFGFPATCDKCLEDE